jgi:hypothetical protein
VPTVPTPCKEVSSSSIGAPAGRRWVLERLISGREHVDDERAARGGRRENLDAS